MPHAVLSWASRLEHDIRVEFSIKPGGGPFFVDKSLKVNCRIKISTASLDAKPPPPPPLFAIIFDAEGLRILFYAAAPDGMKERDEEQWKESELEYSS